MAYSKGWEANGDATVGGSLPPPPCQEAQGALALMLLHVMALNNLTACLDSGDALQAIKMPGGHIPWNCDGDIVIVQNGTAETDLHRKIAEKYMSKYGFEYKSRYGDGQTFKEDHRYSSGERLIAFQMAGAGLENSSQAYIMTIFDI